MMTQQTHFNGNTLILESPKYQTRKDMICLGDEDDQITTRKLTSILQQNNQYILSAIQATLRNEMESAIYKIQADFKQSFEKITIKQLKFQEELSNLSLKITKLDKTCRSIQAENESLQTKMQHLQSNVHITSNEHLQINTSNDRVLILHGFAEHYRESEGEVIDRLISIFYDYLNIDLSGHIEEKN